MLRRFFLKRVLVVWAVASVLTLLIFGGVYKAVAGIGIGAVLSLCRIRLLERSIGAEPDGGKKKSAVLASGLWFILLFSLLMTSVNVDAGLFLGIAGGLLILPFIIMANAVTEKLGITRNAWGDPDSAKNNNEN